QKEKETRKKKKALQVPNERLNNKEEIDQERHRLKELVQRLVEEIKEKLIWELLNSTKIEAGSMAKKDKGKEPRITESVLEERRRMEFLKIGVYNINGIKRNTHRLQELINFSEKYRLNIVGITETNIKEKDAKFMEIQKKRYRDFWSS
ncbi:30437_t:CDS:2, partial [Gigaspora margarita]